MGMGREDRSGRERRREGIGEGGREERSREGRQLLLLSSLLPLLIAGVAGMLTVCGDVGEQKGFYEMHGFKAVKTLEMEDPNPQGEGRWPCHAMVCAPALLPEPPKEGAEKSKGPASLYPKV